MSDETKLGPDLLYPHERTWGDFYCSTVKQLRHVSLGATSLSSIANIAQVDPTTVRQLKNGQFKQPFVKYVEAVNKAMNNGVISINN